MNNIKLALALREGGQTQRCHTMQYSGPYNVAIHSYNALSLLLILYPGHPSASLIRAVMWHDVPERWTGDVPTPAKMAVPILRNVLNVLEQRVLDNLGLHELFSNLTNLERDWLNSVDLLELFMWCREQLQIGNTTVTTMDDQIMKIFADRYQEDHVPPEVMNFINNFEWSRTCECHDLINGDKNDSK